MSIYSVLFYGVTCMITYYLIITILIYVNTVVGKMKIALTVDMEEVKDAVCATL